MLNKKNILYVVGAVFLTVGAVWLFEGRRIYAKVGDFKIYKTDVEARNRLIKLNSPGAQDDLGYAQLEKSYINYQIMRNHGYKVIEDRLEQEVERIDQTTRNPSMLDKIKKEIFSGNSQSYRRAFVIPAAVDEEAYFGFYEENEIVHASTQKKAEDILEELKANPKSLKDIAQKENVTYFLYQISANDISMVDRATMKPIPKNPEERAPIAKEAERVNPNGGSEGGMHREEVSYIQAQAHFWNNEILKGLKTNDVIAQPMSVQDQWYVGRLLKTDGKNKLVELVSIPKKTYSDFFEEQKASVPVRKGFFIF